MKWFLKADILLQCSFKEVSYNFLLNSAEEFWDVSCHFNIFAAILFQTYLHVWENYNCENKFKLAFSILHIVYLFALKIYDLAKVILLTHIFAL